MWISELRGEGGVAWGDKGSTFLHDRMNGSCQCNEKGVRVEDKNASNTQ